MQVKLRLLIVHKNTTANGKKNVQGSERSFLNIRTEDWPWVVHESLQRIIIITKLIYLYGCSRILSGSPRFIWFGSTDLLTFRLLLTCYCSRNKEIGTNKIVPKQVK